MSSMLSQEEINALLKENQLENENNTTEDVATENTAASGSLSPMEGDVLGEITNISMGSAATTLSAILGKKITITTPTVSVTTISEVKEKYVDTYFILTVNYKTGLEGSNMFIMQTQDVGIIVDLMMGGEGTNPPVELGDIHLSAISEAMNQMMGTSSTSISQILNKQIEIFSPTFKIATIDDIFDADAEEAVMISFQLYIEGLVDSNMLQILPISFAKKIVEEILQSNISSTDGNAESLKVENVTIPEKKAMKKQANVPNSVEIAPAQFTAFHEDTNVKTDLPNLDLIMDIGLQLSVELGRTKKRIKDILELTNGSIIELDKLAGEPVDILVNGKPLAHGEVVIIDENFGVRVTGIISPEERVRSLK